MPAKLVAIYQKPENPEQFNEYYFNKHVPLAKTITGLRCYEVNASPLMTPQGPADFYLMATLHFDTLQDIETALASVEGQATAADLANFASAGVELLIFETREV